ncbi:hypothetical protein [Stackebrandtia nassauensis]|uniref:Uncharacterized protein n=1 Tax=Stackebrandtia nassauensis (strain DSM 44728 / CIP 108903 / NRRL B-16338 / NBRC 102104 / LLR-40K-21) TaxID=446470 RepID=D3PY73_STANL|nr:hypothetical protein [Stackebrandtia nassauensis]ADD45402.1 hypothetical protein Snas_5772 [Stackebrandtia nassauensis DSM 44728]
MGDKENNLGLELGQLWLCSRVLLPEAANVYVGMANKATETGNHTDAFNDTLYNGTAYASSPISAAWTELLGQFQDVMSISAQNLYDVCDVLDRTRESFAKNDGMNAEQIGSAMNETVQGYQNGDYRDKDVVEPGERPKPKDDGPGGLRDNPNYDRGE